MSDPKSASNDPSMDDILASIRKIISEDEARAQMDSQRGSRPAATPPVEPRLTPRLQSATRDDVLLLTDLLEEPTSAAGAVPPPIPLPRIDPTLAAEMPQPPVPPVPEPATGPALAGGITANATAAAIVRLNQAVQDSLPAPAAQEPGAVIGENGKTVEDLVKEMLRPMLKEWLDQNLPQMVERYVEREIVRLTRR